MVGQHNCRTFAQFTYNEYYHTVVIATEKLSNSEAKPRCYDNFEGDNNRVVIFLINTCCDHVCFLDSKFIKLFPSLDYEFITNLLSPLFNK